MDQLRCFSLSLHVKVIIFNAPPSSKHKPCGYNHSFLILLLASSIAGIGLYYELLTFKEP